MKRKMISWLSLVAVFFLLFVSCRTDLEATGKHNDEKAGEHLHQNISINVFQKETSLSTVNEFKKKKNSLSGKNTAASDYLKRFFTDETSIYKMDVNNTQTYALRAYNIFESPETVYNLVYSKKGNTVTFSIFKILPDEVIPVYDSEKGIVTKTDHTLSAKTCTDYYSVEIWNCKEGVSWAQCDKCAICLFTSSGYTSYECGGGTGNTGGSGDTGSGGGTGLYDPSGYIFDPNIPPSIEPSYIRAARASSFFTQLSDQAKSWAVDHTDIYCNILEYYLDHIPATSPPPNSYYWDFANFAIQVFMENPYLTWEQFYNQFISNPCEKTKNMLKDPKVQLAIDDITKQAKKAALDVNEGEIGRIEKNGMFYVADVSEDHHVIFNDISGAKGAYHNHTYKGAKIHSPEDIFSILGFAQVQPTVANYGDAYIGMIGAEKCYPDVPECFRMFHYIIRFSGTTADLSKNFTEDEMKKFENKFIDREGELKEKLPYVNFLGDITLNKKGYEKLFFETLNNMDLSGKIILQRVDDDGIIYNINLDANGMPKATPCPL